MKDSNKQSVSAQAIETWCNALLLPQQFKDYCPNGLQVDAGEPIYHIVSGVTASMALIDAAIEKEAQAILVHHGYFWKGEPQTLTGMKGARIRKLMQQGISLLAYHLPLDDHAIHGNNVQLANILGLTLTEALFPHDASSVGGIATPNEPITNHELTKRISLALGREPLYISGDNNIYGDGVKTMVDKTYRRIGICTGGAQGFLTQAAMMSCDAYISGEISEKTTHEARELGVDYYACGHHATEKGGVKSLGVALSQHFGIDVSFVDIANPA